MAAHIIKNKAHVNTPDTDVGTPPLSDNSTESRITNTPKCGQRLKIKGGKNVKECLVSKTLTHMATHKLKWQENDKHTSVGSSNTGDGEINPSDNKKAKQTEIHSKKEL